MRQVKQEGERWQNNKGVGYPTRESRPILSGHDLELERDPCSTQENLVAMRCLVRMDDRSSVWPRDQSDIVKLSTLSAA